MPASTARERARSELVLEIKDEARRQLGTAGASQLSLRAVARELGMVSSALYRYFPTKDALLTALIIDAYDAMADAADDAIRISHRRGPRGVWTALWSAVRGWARQNPHEYALIYGTPIPGYAAPQDTVGPASRVLRAVVQLIAGATTADGPATADEPAQRMAARLRRQLALVDSALGVELPGELTARALLACTHLYGVVSFELNGQFAGTLEPADDFFRYAVEQAWRSLGIDARPSSTT